LQAVYRSVPWSAAAATGSTARVEGVDEGVDEGVNEGVDEGVEAVELVEQQATRRYG